MHFSIKRQLHSEREGEKHHHFLPQIHQSTMPTGKRGSAKKKKKKPKKSLSSNATHPHGESDVDEYSSSKSQESSPHSVVKAETNEHNSSGNQSLTIDRTEEAANKTHSEIEINTGSNSQNSHEKSSSSRSSSSNDNSHVDKKKAVEIQPAAVPDLVQLVKEVTSEIEINRGSNSHNSFQKSSSSRSSRSSSSNDKSHVDKDKVVVIQPAAVADLVQLAKEPLSPTVIEINRRSNSLEKSLSSRSSSLNDKSHVDENKAVVMQPAAVVDLVQPIVDPAKPVSSLVELASQVFDSTKLQEKNDLVVTETPVEQNTCPTSTSEVVGSVPKENEVEKVVSKSKDCLPASTNDACQFCGRDPTDRVSEPETSECSEKQPLVDAASRPAEKTSWKSCCGIFELCSDSGR